MRFKKITALLLVCGSLFASSAFAENENYEYYDNITNIISNIYIDPTYSKSDIINKGLESAMKEDPELGIRLLKASLESLDVYSELFTESEMSDYLNALNKTIYDNNGRRICKDRKMRRWRECAESRTASRRPYSQGGRK